MLQHVRVLMAVELVTRRVRGREEEGRGERIRKEGIGMKEEEKGGKNGREGQGGRKGCEEI